VAATEALLHSPVEVTLASTGLRPPLKPMPGTGPSLLRLAPTRPQPLTIPNCSFHGRGALRACQAVQRTGTVPAREACAAEDGVSRGDGLEPSACDVLSEGFRNERTGLVTAMRGLLGTLWGLKCSAPDL